MIAYLVLTINVFALTVRYTDEKSITRRELTEAPPKICCDGFTKVDGFASKMATCIQSMLKSNPPAAKADIIATAESAGCKDMASQFFGTLVQGLKKVAPKEIEVTASDDTVTVNIQDAGQLFGEVATKSRLPLEWVLDHELVITNAEHGAAGAVRRGAPGAGRLTLAVDVKGLHFWPAKEGVDMTDEYLTGVKGACTLDALKAKPGVFDKCVEAEISAFYAKPAKSSGWTHKAKVYYDNGHNGKTGSLLAAIPDQIMWKFLSKREAGKVAYSLATMTPKTIDRLVFNEAGVAAVTSLYDGENFYKNEEEKAKYVLNFYRASAMGIRSLVEATSRKIPGYGDGLTVATKFANSGMNFAKMSVWGDSLNDVPPCPTCSAIGPEVRQALQDAGITQTHHQMAEHKDILNLVSVCEKVKDGDPQCSGSARGRVNWTSKQSLRFL